MKQAWIPYWLWEDWLNGMWQRLPKEQETHMLQVAIEFMCNHIKYGEAMRCVAENWPNTMLNSLTNPSTNKRAFLGHCAASHAINCPEYITRLAWRELTDEQRFLADKVAQEIIDEWKLKYINTLKSGKIDVM